MSAVADDLAAMEADWPDWRIRRTGRTGKLWSAVRRGRQLTVEQTSAGLAMTLLADSREDLAEQLQAQSEIPEGA